MTRYNRLGECNRCGQCCGAPGGPDRRPPFCRLWYWSLRHWSLDDVNELCPQLSMCGLTQIGEDTLGVESAYGMVRIQGKPFYYVWVQGVGLCRDSSAAHDGSEYEPECPFLKPDPGDGTRPCALVGTNQDGAFKKWCEQEPTYPRREELVQEWIWRYPDCSYTWEVIPE